MRSRIFALAAALWASLAAAPVHAQDEESAPAPTAEQMIEVAREVWAAIDPRCTVSTTDEIVVCAPKEEQPRLESPTEEAIRKHERPPGTPHAAGLFDPPPCIPSLLSFCGKIGRPVPRPLLVDLTAIPEPLAPNVAALVFRAEDAPAEADGKPAVSAGTAPAVTP